MWWQKYCWCAVISRSVMFKSFATAWTVACQAPLWMGFPRQEYWSGLPCSPPGDLPNQGIEPRYPALQANSLWSDLSHQGSPQTLEGFAISFSRVSSWFKYQSCVSCIGRPILYHWATREVNKGFSLRINDSYMLNLVLWIGKQQVD